MSTYALVLVYLQLKEIVHILFLFKERSQEFIDTLFKGVKFEDVRVGVEEWPNEKQKYPLGQLPVLEVNGKPICQSWAIMRYLGKKLDLAGKDEIEAAHLDQVLELWRDFDLEAGKWMLTLGGYADPSIDREKYFDDKVIPALDKFGPQFEALLNEAGTGFFGLSGVSYVDFYISENVYTMCKWRPEFMETYFPYLVQHMRKVHSLPQLKAHYSYYKYTYPLV